VPHAAKSTSLAGKIARCRRIVIKLGTNVIMRDDGRIALGRFYGIAESVARLRHEGREILLVSSGAIGLGMDRLGMKKRPTELAALQACAAIGQSRLMAIYDDAFEKLGCRIAQVLLTEDDFRDPQRFANLRGTLASLLEMGVIPIINENDTVSTVELDRPGDTPNRKRVFGDNDKLSGLVLTHVGADLLVLLSDIDGLYSGDPHAPNATLVAEVREVTPEIRSYAQGKNGRGRGGMATKLEAARIASAAGRFAVIANGHIPHVVERVCAGENVGTWFWPEARTSEGKTTPGAAK
jgi:glutamate 5-kinase